MNDFCLCCFYYEKREKGYCNRRIVEIKNGEYETNLEIPTCIYDTDLLNNGFRLINETEIMQRYNGAMVRLKKAQDEIERLKNSNRNLENNLLKLAYKGETQNE